MMVVSLQINMNNKEINEILCRFANNVKKYREEEGISQEKLAELANLHRTYIGSIERAEKIPSLITIVKIARALKVSNSQLID